VGSSLRHDRIVLKTVKADNMDHQPYNPLHGVTLKIIVTQLVDHFGFDYLGKEIKIRCFTDDPSINSSLKFLRKTPWAREKVEALYIQHKTKLDDEHDSV
jgi:uncharacterized protein (DUF2132 family)